MNIDVALRALCEKHDLVAISLNVHTGITDPYVYAHWITDGGQECANAYGNTCAEAIAAAIRAANEARAIVPDVPALEIGEIAA